jgi:hypothetical protein
MGRRARPNLRLVDRSLQLYRFCYDCGNDRNGAAAPEVAGRRERPLPVDRRPRHQVASVRFTPSGENLDAWYPSASGRRRPEQPSWASHHVFIFKRERRFGNGRVRGLNELRTSHAWRELARSVWSKFLSPPTQPVFSEVTVGRPAPETPKPLRSQGSQGAWKGRFETSSRHSLCLWLLSFLSMCSAEKPLLSEWGAGLYFSARLVYLPLYAFGVPLLRSLVSNTAFAGIVLLLLASVWPAM